jgi:hypothetical protein
MLSELRPQLSEISYQETSAPYGTYFLSSILTDSASVAVYVIRAEASAFNFGVRQGSMLYRAALLTVKTLEACVVWYSPRMPTAFPVEGTPRLLSWPNEGETEL